MTNKRKYTLADLTTQISYGYTASASFQEIGPKFLRITDIQNGVVNWDSVPFCEISSAVLDKYLLKQGDIVVARTGNSTGENYIYSGMLPTVFASYLIRLRINTALADPSFVWYQMRSPSWRHFISCNRAKSAQAGANATTLGQYVIALPSLPEQQKIAAVLSSIDAKIELNNRINAELEAMAMTLYNYWFVQFDFPDENDRPYKSSGGKVVYNPILKKQIPEGWDAVSLQAVASCIQRGISPVYTEKSSVTVLNQKCIRNHKIDFSKSRQHDVHRKSVPVERFIQNGDILVNSTGVGTLGRLTQVWGSPKEITIDSHITLIRPNPSIISPAFLGYSLINRENEIENLGEGSTGQTELSRNRLGALQILNPHTSIQRKFSSIVEPQLELIYKNLHENQQLTQLRDWLLPMLMNGQIAVD